MIRMAPMLKESELPVYKVYKGMIGIDENGDPAKILAIVSAKDWKKVKRYDKTGWLDWDAIAEAGIDPMTHLVAVSEWDGRTTVYLYGEKYHGFHVPTKSQNFLKNDWLKHFVKQKKKQDPSWKFPDWMEAAVDVDEGTIVEDTNAATVVYKTLVSMFQEPEKQIEKNGSITKNYRGLKITVSKDPKPYQDLIYKAVCELNKKLYEGYGRTVKEAISDLVFKIAVSRTFLSNNRWLMKSSPRKIS